VNGIGEEGSGIGPHILAGLAGLFFLADAPVISTGEAGTVVRQTACENLRLLPVNIVWATTGQHAVIPALQPVVL
jgi:hypothetical protein